MYGVRAMLLLMLFGIFISDISAAELTLRNEVTVFQESPVIQENGFFQRQRKKTAIVPSVSLILISPNFYLVRLKESNGFEQRYLLTSDHIDRLEPIQRLDDSALRKSLDSFQEFIRGGKPCCHGRSQLTKEPTFISTGKFSQRRQQIVDAIEFLLEKEPTNEKQGEFVKHGAFFKESTYASVSFKKVGSRYHFTVVNDSGELFRYALEADKFARLENSTESDQLDELAKNQVRLFMQFIKGTLPQAYPKEGPQLDIPFLTGKSFQEQRDAVIRVSVILKDM